MTEFKGKEEGGKGSMRGWTLPAHDAAPHYPVMFKRKNLLIYAALLVAWLAFAGWQRAEHERVEEAALNAKLHRANDLADTFSLVILRIPGRFGMVPTVFLEDSMADLADTADVRAIALFNSEGEEVVSVGENVSLSLEEALSGGERWKEKTLIVSKELNIGEDRRRPGGGSDDGRRGGRDGGDGRRDERDGERGRDERDGERGPETRPAEELRPGQRGSRGGPPPFQMAQADGEQGARRQPPTTRPVAMEDDATTQTRPWWADQNWVRVQGPHHLVISMWTDSTYAEVRQDAFMRLSLVLIGLLAALGLAAAWFNAARTLDLQVRLARAQETNKMLREMNLAAAGLAHETRNPLNLVRGMAQIIAKEADGGEVQSRAQNIVQEVDRVASRLNEFLDYSKPRHANLAPTNLKAVISDVAQALETDLEDKRVTLSFDSPETVVIADEMLLRQVLFNLLLNALQSVPEEGRVSIAVVPDNGRLIRIEVRDDGPGVPPESQDEIFRPYFTTRQGGTGLGLAIVRQFVVAHQWDIRYLSKEGLSVFQISGVRLAQ